MFCPAGGRFDEEHIRYAQKRCTDTSKRRRHRLLLFQIKTQKGHCHVYRRGCKRTCLLYHDILEFIKIKRNSGELANFNISVSITDAFIEALKSDAEYDLINPRSGEK